MPVFNSRMRRKVRLRRDYTLTLKKPEVIWSRFGISMLSERVPRGSQFRGPLFFNKEKATKNIRQKIQRRFLASQADANVGRSNTKIYMDKEDALIEKLVREENKEDREATMARFKTYMNKRTIRK